MDGNSTYKLDLTGTNTVNANPALNQSPHDKSVRVSATDSGGRTRTTANAINATAPASEPARSAYSAMFRASSAGDVVS
jgi:hypothetical protein